MAQCIPFGLSGKGSNRFSEPPSLLRIALARKMALFDEATAILNEYLTANPNSFPAWNLLRAIHWRKSDIPAYRVVTITLCDLHLQAMDYEAAWEDYEDFLQLGGEKMPADIWFDLCRVPEKQRHFERALSEYEALASTHPSARQSLLAQLCAARICLKQLNRPHDAAYKLPHLLSGIRTRHSFPGRSGGGCATLYRRRCRTH